MQADGRTDLLALSIAVLGQAKHRLAWSIRLAVLASLPGLANTLSPIDEDPLFGPVSAFAAAGFAVASYVCWRLYERRYDLASEVKRLVLLEDGLGWTVPPATRIDVRDRAGKAARAAVSTYVDDAGAYYASIEAPGPRRLLDLVQESAFYTARNYGMLRNGLLALVAIFSVLTFFLVWSVMVSPAAQSERLKLGQFTIALVPAIISLGAVGWSFKLTDLSHAVQRIYNDLETLRAGPAVELQDVMRLMSEYNCQLAQGIAVPDAVWQYMQSQLNELWDEKVKLWH